MMLYPSRGIGGEAGGEDTMQSHLDIQCPKDKRCLMYYARADHHYEKCLPVLHALFYSKH